MPPLPPAPPPSSYISAKLKDSVDLIQMLDFVTALKEIDLKLPKDLVLWDLTGAQKYPGLRSAKNPIPDLGDIGDNGADASGTIERAVNAETLRVIFNYKNPDFDENYFTVFENGEGDDWINHDLIAFVKGLKRDKTLSQEARDKINKSLPALAEYAAWGLVVYDPKNKVEMLDCEQTQKLNKFLSNYVEFSPPGSYRMLGDKASQAVKNTHVKFP